MRGLKLGVLLAALGALTATGIAVADESKPTKFASVEAHFTASGKLKTMACTTNSANSGATSSNNTPGGTGSTGSGNSTPSTTTVKVKRATFSGTSTSADSRLNGSLQIAVRLVVGRNGLGFATGAFRIKGKPDAQLTAVVTSTNRLDGFIRSGRKLFANFSGTLTGSTLTGDVGTGSHTNSAIVDMGTTGCDS
jgi:hypothetical protein